MAGHPIRKLLVLAAVGAVIAAVVRALRGEPAPQFSSHPTVTGGPTPSGTPSTGSSIEPAPEAAVPVVAEPAPLPVATEAPPATGGAPTDEEPVAEVLRADATWVAPLEGACPDGYPIKAKLSSKIYHQPGGAMYERTKPDRCYASAADAEADGYRAAKR